MMANKKLLFLSLFMAFLAGCILLKPHKSYAYFTDGNAVPNSAKQAVIASCGAGNYVAQTTWITRTGDTTDTTAVIDGSYNVYLQYNMAVVRCANGQSTDIFGTQFHIIDGSFSYSGINYNDSAANLRNVDVWVVSPDANGQPYSIESIPFVVNIPNFVNSSDVYITARSQQYNIFSNGTEGCITADNSDVDPRGDATNCPITTPTAPIYIIGAGGGGNPVQVQGRVYDTVTGASIPGVSIQGCAGTTTTDGGGNAYMTFPQGTGFCFRAAIPSGYKGYVIKPYAEGYRGCPANTECTITPDLGYENQQAGGFSGNGYDRNSDIGYDIGLIPVSDTPPTVDVSYDCSPPYNITITVEDVDDNVNNATPVIDYRIGGNPQSSTTSWAYTYSRPPDTIADPIVVYDASSTGINGIVPPGGLGPPGSRRNAARLNGLAAILPMTIPPCGERYEVEGIPSKPVLRLDTEYPTAADYNTSIRFKVMPATYRGTINNLPQRRVLFSCPYIYDSVSNTCNPPVPTYYVNEAFSNLDLPVSAASYNLGLGTYNDGDVPSLNLDKNVGAYICNKIYIEKTIGIVDFAGNIVWWDKTNNAKGETHYADCERVVNKPYARFYGNDIAAGSGFDNTLTGASCSGVDVDIKTYNNKVAGGWLGGGAQIGAIASGSITQLASMSLIDAMGGGGVDNARDFANTPANGGFGARTCAYDYPEPTGLSTVPDIRNGIGPQMLPANTVQGAIAGYRGQRIYYVNGDLRITGDIAYDLAARAQNALPSLTLVVRGNIYIDPSVERLDGTYIAIPKSNSAADLANTGQIFTCDNNGFAPPTDKSWYVPPLVAVGAVAGKCFEHTLTVNGSFIAQKVNFLRTKGSLKTGAAGEVYSSSVNPGANTAEIFRYSPESFISASQVPPFDLGVKYDSILSLPPSL